MLARLALTNEAEPDAAIARDGPIAALCSTVAFADSAPPPGWDTGPVGAALS